MSNMSGADATAWAVVFQILPMTVKESEHLRATAERLRALAPDMAWAESLETDVARAEMLDAFVARFGRLQDTLGDKLLPALLRASQERTAAQLDNLLRAEKLGWIDSAERWIALRALRNRLVHEYVSSATDLLQATFTALNGVADLTDTQKRMMDYAQGYSDRGPQPSTPTPTVGG
jgi:hypothetical protein